MTGDDSNAVFSLDVSDKRNAVDVTVGISDLSPIPDLLVVLDIVLASVPTGQPIKGFREAESASDEGQIADAATEIDVMDEFDVSGSINVSFSSSTVNAESVPFEQTSMMAGSPEPCSVLSIVGFDVTPIADWSTDLDMSLDDGLRTFSRISISSSCTFDVSSELDVVRHVDDSGNGATVEVRDVAVDVGAQNDDSIAVVEGEVDVELNTDVNSNGVLHVIVDVSVNKCVVVVVDVDIAVRFEGTVDNEIVFTVVEAGFGISLESNAVVDVAIEVDLTIEMDVSNDFDVSMVDVVAVDVDTAVFVKVVAGNVARVTDLALKIGSAVEFDVPHDEDVTISLADMSTASFNGFEVEAQASLLVLSSK